MELNLSKRSEQELQEESKRLAQSLREIEKRRPLVETEFTQSWASAVDAFERTLNPSMAEVQDMVERRIRDTPMVSLSNFKKDLPQFLTRTIEGRLAKPAERLETALREASRKLETEFPSLGIGDAGHISMKVKEDRSPLIKSGVLTGVAMLLPILPGAIASTIPYVGWLLGFGTTLALMPPGLVLVGLAALTIPFSYRTTKLKLREEMEEASRKQIKTVFDMLRYERVADLRRAGTDVLEGYRRRLAQQVMQLEATLESAKERRTNPETSGQLQEAAVSLQNRLLEFQKLLPPPA
jgi:hypothetical protein